MKIEIELTSKEVEAIIAKEMLLGFPGKFAAVEIKSYGSVIVEILDKAPETKEEEGE